MSAFSVKLWFRGFRVLGFSKEPKVDGTYQYEDRTYMPLPVTNPNPYNPKLQPPKLVLVETANLCTASTKARPP